MPQKFIPFFEREFYVVPSWSTEQSVLWVRSFGFALRNWEQFQYANEYATRNCQEQPSLSATLKQLFLLPGVDCLEEIASDNQEGWSEENIL